MKITARAAAASFTVTDESGNTVATYSVENFAFDTDISGLLKCVSQAAHLFKQLDDSHSVASQPAAPSREYVGVRDRAPEVQELIDAVRRFKSRTNSITVDLSTEQHDGYMALSDALTNVTDDASEANVKVLCDRARDYVAMFPINAYAAVRNRVEAAIAAVA